MTLKQFLEYIVGLDILRNHLRTEKELKASAEKQAGEELLPLECGLEAAIDIYKLRSRTFVEYPLKVMSRISGVDYVYRLLRR